MFSYFFFLKSDIEVIGAIGDDDTAATFVNNVNQDDYGFSFVTGSSYDTVRSEISLASKTQKHGSFFCFQSLKFSFNISL
jgi:hypothetical protein